MLTDAILFEVSTWTLANWLGVSLVLFIMAALLYEFVTWDDGAIDEKEVNRD